MTTSQRSFDQIWGSALKEPVPDPNGSAGELMNAIAFQLGVEQVQFEKVNDVALFLVDLGLLGFTGMDLNVFMITHPARDQADRDRQLQLLREYATVVRTFGLCFHIVLGPTPSRGERLAMREWHIVRMYQEDLSRLFTERVPLSAFYSVTRNQIELSNLCPYNTTKVSRGSMFVGRRRELLRLTDELDRDFIVNGARRIGKTSLLTRAFAELDRRVNPMSRDSTPDSQPDGRRVFLFNGLNWRGWRDAAHRIARELEPKSEARVDLNVNNLTKIIERQARRRHAPLLFFFDEFDRIVENDRAEQWPFFGVMAELKEMQSVRIVLAGYRSVSLVDREEYSPLRDKLEILTLSPLERSDTHNLLVPIMQNLGITLRNPNEFAQKISLDTANFPFMVQYFGRQLFMKAVASRANLAPSDVDEIEKLPETMNFIYNHYVDNTREGDRVFALERACCLLLASRGGASWDIQDFVSALDAFGSKIWEDKVHEALTNLSRAAILLDEGARYSFAFPMVAKMLRQTHHDFDAAVRRYLE